jgi:glyoxylase-like metal-dependent hydrolase (beta-lactamase superfamily II)
VLAVRYGTRQASAAEVFLNYHSYHEPDRPLRMDYFFWVARNPAREIVIDTGFSPAAGASRGRTMRLDTVPALRAAGRLTLTGQAYSVAPGIELTQVGGHTPGQAIVTVATGEGPVILASDAVHYYEELERDRPFATVANLADMYAAFDQIREMGAEPGARVVAGHDPLVAERFGGRAGSDDMIQISAEMGRQ